MKVAVPTKNNKVDDHFGHCEYYSIYETDDQKNIIATELYWSQGGCGCKSNIAALLNELGVFVMLAGNMGQGEINMLKSHKIEVVRGCSGFADDIVKDYLNGEISDQDIICYPEGHSCNHWLWWFIKLHLSVYFFRAI